MRARGPCLIWDGPMHHAHGYLIKSHPLRLKTGESVVHRAIWAATHGPIPADVVVHHKCKVPACYNIRHLRLGPRRGQYGSAHAKCEHGHTVLSPYRVDYTNPCPTCCRIQKGEEIT